MAHLDIVAQYYLSHVGEEKETEEEKVRVRPCSLLLLEIKYLTLSTIPNWKGAHSQLSQQLKIADKNPIFSMGKLRTMKEFSGHRRTLSP